MAFGRLFSYNLVQNNTFSCSLMRIFTATCALRCPVTPEAAGSSPVSSAILFKGLGDTCLTPSFLFPTVFPTSNKDSHPCKERYIQQTAAQIRFRFMLSTRITAPLVVKCYYKA